MNLYVTDSKLEKFEEEEEEEVVYINKSKNGPLPILLEKDEIKEYMFEDENDEQTGNNNKRFN